MMWIIIMGILIVLIIAIVITMLKIIKGSNNIKETRERGGRAPRNSGDSRSRRPANERPRQGAGRPARREEPAKTSGRSSKGRSGHKRRWKIILSDIATHEEFEFIFVEDLGVGRAFSNDSFEKYLVINDPKVSKLHCSIYAGTDNLFIQDEGSSNYTFVNGNKVNKPMMIQKEDVIGLGNTELEILKVFRESD
jgi:hypothetical protein